MAYFKPESNLNPETMALYAQNQLHVTRQLYYGINHQKSLDLVLSVNGIPVASAELKNHFTRQNIFHAEEQYKYDRDPSELLFRFKYRTFVHFAVDPDVVSFSTRLHKADTRFFPLNKGNGLGAGNPENKDGYKSDYLWKELWQRDSFLDLVGRFVHLQQEEITDKATGKTRKKEAFIFPRYHQIDAVRKLAADVRIHGAGKNYLIQHSAGSGKSNSIAWLAYRLSALHTQENERIFHSVVVITDRRVLDNQLQDTIYQFEHKTGVVQKIDKDSDQLAEALIGGVPIIITTLQKFPFVIGKIDKLPNRNYAVIVDEAHSSQGGEASRKMKQILSAQTLEEAAEEEKDPEDAENYEDELRKTISTYGRQPNLSFFAFTATPKYKTLQVFGITGPDGLPRPFHLYSMRQAIEEGFIHDVLANYTTYEFFFKLGKAIEDDPLLNKKKASIAIGRFVSLHPHNIRQKTEIMVEHFRQVTCKQIGGRAKAMVVTGSRKHALRYYLSFKQYIQEKGYEEVKALVAFSGKVIDDGYPDGVTEPELNGFKEKELPERFDTDEYNVLLVASKYQTGFDQPLLHTIYVDKKLSGVLAVQTLSRLNRTIPGKVDTFVLDFANDRQTILKSFQPYYEVTQTDLNPDPNLLYDLRNKLEDMLIIWQTEIENFCKAFLTKKDVTRNQSALYSAVKPAISRFKDLTEDEQEEFKKQLVQWLRLYAFITQIINLQDIELEKFALYGKYLETNLPKKSDGEKVNLSDEVSLDYYRLQKMQEGNIGLVQDDGGFVYGATEVGMTREKEEKAVLSEIISVLNKRFGTDFTPADQLFFDQIEQELAENETLQKQAQSNTLENFKYGFEDLFLDILIGRIDQNQEITRRIMNEKDFGAIVKEWMVKRIYNRVGGNQSGKSNLP
jgi:type I restriction enzyme R subunit